MQATKQINLDEQLAEATKQLNAKEAERSRFVVALEQARTWLGETRERRSQFVKELAGAADDAERGFLEEQIDEADREIVSHERFIESHTLILEEIVAGYDALRAEWTTLDVEAKAAEKARALEAWRQEIEQDFNTASDALDRARTTLGQLVIVARGGADAFGHPAHVWLSALAESFFRKQTNLDGRGFQRRFDYSEQMFNFTIFPAVRKELK
jgi:hypothetical protein